MRFRIDSIFILILLLIVTACTPVNDVDVSTAVITYFDALVNQNESTPPLSEIVCASYEGQAQIDFDSFGAVDATLDDAVCDIEQLAENEATVACTGTISVTYDGETNTLMDLADFMFTVVKEDAQWLMCGYK